MLPRKRPSLNKTQAPVITSKKKTSRPRRLNRRASPAPPAGILNGASHVQAQQSTFTDFSGNPQHVEQHINVTHGRLDSEPSLYQLLQPVSASYKDRLGKIARCLVGTRERVLNEIKSWADGTHPICWLNGPAGSGKSTIAQTVAEWCTDKGRLGASFFFFRGTGDRDKISHLIPTLAFQLSATITNMEPLVKKALVKEPFLTHPNTRLSYQFEKLIMEPMLSLAYSSFMQNASIQKQKVIVIDALDECNILDGESMDDFIDAVVEACMTCMAKNNQVPFRLLVTSRIEEHLRMKLETPDANRISLQLKLQQYDATQDIRLFFRSEFTKIYAANRRLMIADDIQEPWPREDVLDVLVEEAGGSYIYASTFVSFVQEAGGMPHQRLLDTLKAHGLDPLYMQVFSRALSPGVARGNVVDVRWVMGILLHLKSPLPIKDLAALITVPPRNLVASFLGIQSILLIPETNNDPVHLVHTSLRDFLTTESRSGPHFTNPPDYHASIAIYCLNIMQRNRDLFWFVDGPLEYAFKNGLYHLQQAVHGWENCHPDSSLFVLLINSLTEFTSSVFDCWVHATIRNRVPNGYSEIISLSKLSRYPQDLQLALSSLSNMMEHTSEAIKNFADFHLIEQFFRRRRELQLWRQRQEELWLRSELNFRPNDARLCEMIIKWREHQGRTGEQWEQQKRQCIQQCEERARAKRIQRSYLSN